MLGPRSADLHHAASSRAVRGRRRATGLPPALLAGVERLVRLRGCHVCGRAILPARLGCPAADTAGADRPPDAGADTVVASRHPGRHAVPRPGSAGHGPAGQLGHPGRGAAGAASHGGWAGPDPTRDLGSLPEHRHHPHHRERSVAAQQDGAAGRRVPHRARLHGRGPRPRVGQVAGPDPARRRELPDLRHAHRARADRRPGRDQGRGRGRQRRPRRARPRDRRRDRRGRRRRGRAATGTSTSRSTSSRPAPGRRAT